MSRFSLSLDSVSSLVPKTVTAERTPSLLAWSQCHRWDYVTEFWNGTRVKVTCTSFRSGLSNPSHYSPFFLLAFQ
ncbi:Dynein regulatory complex subunit 7 [Manis javanica]|nr:Dynein regulatory complex subunit 7 [Manis javanica]